jgi:putative membrane protein
MNILSPMGYMMDDMWGGNYGYGMGYSFPFSGWGMMLVWLVIALIVGYLVYKDANSRGMNGLLWWILILIPFIGIIVLIAYVILRETSGQKMVTGEKTAMDILKERYAKGEITSEQFEKINEDLKK